MLEDLEIKDDINRQEVIDFLKTSKFDLEKFKLKNFNDFPGAIELIDEKGRSIVVFYNYLIEKVEVIYKNLKKDALEVYLSVVMFLLEKYKEESGELKEVINVEKIDEDHIRFFKKSERAKWESKIIAISPIFDINNELYDVYEYLETQINDLKIMRSC